MNLLDKFDGSASPFEGDQAVVWRSLPASASVTKAVLKVTPVAAPGGVLFEEAITFPNNPGDLGATKNEGTNFAEVDFHKRRTLSSVHGQGVPGANLQVDVGGIYVELNNKGAIRQPNDALFPVPSNGELPGLTVSKLKLTAIHNIAISDVVIRSVPSNLTIRVGPTGPIWTHVGEMSASDMSSDFSAVLQAYLPHTAVENGFYVVPLMVHSDTLARLLIEISVDYVFVADLQPPGIKEVVLPFDFNTLPKSQPDVLSVNLPYGSRVVPGKTTVSAVGAFNGSRIVHGVPAGTPPPPFTVTISPVEAQGQLIEPPNPPVSATAVDVLVESLTATSILTADLRRDLNGKPDGASLLPSPIEFQLHSTVQRQPAWTNVPLPASFSFENEPCWLVLSSVEGEVLWSTQPASAISIGVQHTLDGGLSWHYAGALNSSGPLEASFRLRDVPSTFQIPIGLRVGGGSNSSQLSLDRFQPLGRVDFTLDTPDLADAMNQYISTSAPPACPEGEHLLNGDFESWTALGNALGGLSPIDMAGVAPSALACSANGRWIYVAGIITGGGGESGGGSGTESGSPTGISEQEEISVEEKPVILTIDSVCDELTPRLISLASDSVPLAIAVGGSSTSAYLITAHNLITIDLSKGAPLPVALTPAIVGGLFGESYQATNPVSFTGQVAVAANHNVIFFALTQAGDSWIIALSCEALEQFCRGARTLGSHDVITHKLTGKTTFMALSPNESELYFGADADTVVRIDDASSLTLAGSITVADHPVAVSFTRAGDHALVATSGGVNAIQLIDTGTREVIGSVNLNISPTALVTSPVEAAAYVLVSAPAAANGTQLLPVDLQHMQVGSPIALNIDAERILITPQGDQIYVSSSSEESVTSLSIGTRTPAEWFVTSDSVTTPAGVLPYCFQFSSEIAVVFALRSGRKLLPNSAPAGFSQVVPVSGRCPYEFTFLGISESEGSVAEIFWMDQSGALLKTDTVPITVFSASTGGSGEPQFAEHLLDTTSPSGASQAEVRFSVPAGVLAAVSSVQLKGTKEILTNTELQILQGSVPIGWALQPATLRGVSVIEAQTGIRLFNADVDTAEMVQSIAIRENQIYVFNFKGRAVNPGSSLVTPQVQLRWLRSDGSPAATPVTLAINTLGFDLYPASGTTPSGASEVQVALVVPPETGLEIESVSLQQPNAAVVPLTFISQAPGQLRVSRSQVAYDVLPGQPPPIPSSGLATPTPPGSQPGDPPCTAYCSDCHEDSAISKAQPHLSQSGRPMTVGVCERCGSTLIRPGGPRVAGAPLLRLPTLPPHRPLSLLRKATGISRAIPPLSEVLQEGQLKQFADVGITSLQDLASTSADKITIKGISRKRVTALIERARNLISTTTPSYRAGRTRLKWA